MLLEYIQKGLIKGYGTYQIKDPFIIEMALKNGYNFFDTAELYKNESMVIDAITKFNSSKPIFVSTKISYLSIERGEIEKSFYERLKVFEGLKINVLLLHKPSNNCRKDWQILCDLYHKHKDRIDYIGVSNYDINHLEQLKGMQMPFINQIELSPFNIREKLVEYCRDKDVIIVSHTTLTRKTKFDSKTLQNLANRYETTVAKILLKWAVQNGYITIPRSSKLDHLIENIKETHFDISPDDMKSLNELNEDFYLTKVLF